MNMPGRKYNSGNSYRFGFGGQEKSDEIKGDGNSYTASYWEYDPRLARRWNVDPMVKANRSPYDAFSNNPIIKIDPKGDDDYWSIDMKTGKIALVKSHDVGRKIYVMMGDIPVLLSDVDVNWKNKQLTDGLADIIATYAQRSKLIFNANCPDENGERESGTFNGGIGIAKAKSDDVVAFYSTQDKGIFAAVQKGRINSALSDYGNMANVFSHEKFHKEDHASGADKQFGSHFLVYIKQMEDPTFQNTTDDFKLGTAISALSYFMYYSKNAKGNEELTQKLNDLYNRFQAIEDKYGMIIYESESERKGTKTLVYGALTKKEGNKVITYTSEKEVDYANPPNDY